MRPRAWSGPIAVFLLLCCAELNVGGAQQAPPAAGQGGAQKPQPGSPPPTGPLAVAKYKDVQVMKDVPADQFDITMDYFDVNLLQGSSSPYVNEQSSFDATSGLLVRRRVVTRAADRGSMVEQFDYSDYRDVAGVKMPFTIKRTDWSAVDTLTIADVNPNVPIDDAKFARPKR